MSTFLWTLMMKTARTLEINNAMRNITLVCTVVVAALGLAACNKVASHASLSAGPAVDSLKVFKLQAGKLDKSISLPGELLAYERVEIRPKVTGYIKQLKVDIGANVKKGQVLALVDAPEIQSRLGEGNSKMSAARARYQTSLDTYKRIAQASKTKGVISASELQKASNQMLADSAEYESQRYAFESYKQIGNYLALTSPFNGTVTQRNVYEGSYVGGANEKPLLVIEDTRRLRLRIAVPEAFTGVDLKDNKVKFNTKSYPNKSFDAVLVRKAGSIDANTRTEIWEFEVSNPDNALKAGSFANVSLSVSRKEPSFFVPFSAVVTTLEKKFVIKVSRDSTRWIDVSPGLNLADKTEIFGALQEGDTLVIKANEEIKPNEKVYVKL